MDLRPKTIKRMSLITIITINLNNAIGLEDTIRSIKEQFYQNIELIVIDGFSIDESLNIIKKYDSFISKSLIERDKGLFDAMNKGLDYATGDFVLFLNSGDTFYNDLALEKLTSNIIDKEKLYFGRARNIFQKKTCYFTPNFKITALNFEKWLAYDMPSHQATLFPRSFYKVNKYDLSFKIAADNDYKRRAINLLDCIFVDSILVNFELGGVSSLPKSIHLVNKILTEINLIDKKHGTYRIVNSTKHFFSYYLKYIFYTILGKHIYFKLLSKILMK